jgi:hypothetical protein
MSESKPPPAPRPLIDLASWRDSALEEIRSDGQPPAGAAPIGEHPPATAMLWAPPVELADGVPIHYRPMPLLAQPGPLTDWGRPVGGGIYLPAPRPYALKVYLHGGGQLHPLHHDELGGRRRRRRLRDHELPTKEIPMEMPPTLTGDGVPFPAVAPTDNIPRGTLPQPGCQLGVALVDAEGRYFELHAVVDHVHAETGAIDCVQLGGDGRWLGLPKWDHDASELPRMGWF